MPNNEIDKAERLAQNLAKGTLRPHWVVRVRGHLFAVPKPVMSGLALAELKAFLRRIDSSFEAEFDENGRRTE